MGIWVYLDRFFITSKAHVGVALFQPSHEYKTTLALRLQCISPLTSFPVGLSLQESFATETPWLAYMNTDRHRYNQTVTPSRVVLWGGAECQGYERATVRGDALRFHLQFHHVLEL